MASTLTGWRHAKIPRISGNFSACADSVYIPGSLSACERSLGSRLVIDMLQRKKLVNFAVTNRLLDFVVEERVHKRQDYDL